MNSRRVLARALPLLGVLAGMGFLAYVARPHWSSIRDAGSGISGAWVLAGAAGLVVHYGVAFAIWRVCLRAAGAAPTLQQAADMWVPSLLARYVPGRVWSHGVRVALARRAGIALPGVTAAVGWEMLLSLGVAGAVSLAVLPRAALDAPLRVAVLAFTMTCVGALAAAQFLASRARASWVARIGLARSLAGATVLSITVAHLLGWAVYGLVHWCFARALMPVAPGELPVITGAVALAWIGGYLAFFTPAGLGVREGLLTLLLAPRLGVGPVVLLAAMSRLAAVSVEILLFAAWSAWRLRTPNVSRRP